MRKRPFVLVILDGWGLAPPHKGNAIDLANTPNFDKLWSVYPHTQLLASGEAVGLPKGEDGNSETGHLNLGAGKIVFQDLPRINNCISDGSFFEIEAFKKVIKHIKENNSNLHLMGLIGFGGVHSNLEHLFALLRLAKNEGLKNVYLHLFTDGRDSPPHSAMLHISNIQEEIEKIGIGKIATLCGRYFAMDRDHRWERTQKAYELITQGKGKTGISIKEALKETYNREKTDEFLEPLLLEKEGLVKNNDGVIFFNFRIDRPRQLTKAFVLKDFEKLKLTKVSFDPYAEKYGLKQYQTPSTEKPFTRKIILKNLCFVTMTEYEKGLPTEIAFPPRIVKMPLSRVLAEKEICQLHLAETEKERFITYYFNGQREKPFPGEDKIEIPSPKVATYDQKPEMSAYEITDTLLERLKLGLYDFFVVNFANPDMVGHTGVLKAGIKACEVVDECLGKLIRTILNLDGICFIVADHGNTEEMLSLIDGKVDTKHSVNPVPFIIVGKQFAQNYHALKKGVLADVAPTILSVMGINKPQLMTGNNLLS